MDIIIIIIIIIIIVYNDRERKILKKFLSLQCDDNITSAPEVTVRLNLCRVQGDGTGRAN
jgi:hypothetical protein